MSAGSTVGRRTGRFCIRCDNRHGCRGEEPLCLCLEPGEKDGQRRGRALMIHRGLLPHCRSCSLFRKCWAEEAFRRALKRAGPKKDRTCER